MSEEKKYPHRFQPGNDYRIATTQRSHELLQIQRAKRLRSEMSGRIDAVKRFCKEEGIECDLPDPNDLSEEELIHYDGDAKRFFYEMHDYAFLKAAKKTGQDGSAYRGLSEGLPKVVGTAEDPRTRQPEPPPAKNVPIEILLELAAQIEAEQARQRDAERAIIIDAEAWAAGKT